MTVEQLEEFLKTVKEKRSLCISMSRMITHLKMEEVLKIRFGGERRDYLKDRIRATLHRQEEYRKMAESPRPKTWSANNKPWPGYLGRGGKADGQEKAYP